MAISRPILGCILLVLLAGILCRCEPTEKPATQSAAAAARLVSGGWHPWYEIKVDPENAQALILCGTKWDSANNAPFGFVYSSSDGGRTWTTALEDKSSAWVTEQSCAFGRFHHAYFLSEASKVIDGHPHHDLGTTRLFVSTDSGRSWRQTTKTGWADWSTSAASSATGRLYTFYNATTGDPGRRWGSAVGLLTFSPDGSSVTGPFFEAKMQETGFQGVFPSNAVAVNSGAVVALYYGMKRTPQGTEAQLGVIHASGTFAPLLSHTELITLKGEEGCFSLSDYAMAYDAKRNRLYALYIERCDDARISLTFSDDEGGSWSEGISLVDNHLRADTMRYPSLTVVANGDVLLLWEEGQRSGRWLLSRIHDETLAGPPVELSHGSTQLTVSNDSLWAWMYQPFERRSVETTQPSSPAAMLELRSESNVLWRVSGLAMAENQLVAVWTAATQDGMRLCAAQMAPPYAPSADFCSSPVVSRREFDVTQQTVLLYRGPMRFDPTTRTLSICVSVGNRGPASIKVPVKLEVAELKSSAAKISVLNSANGLDGAGAIWDITGSVTGDRIPPQTDSNPFCLLFRAVIPPSGLPLEKNELVDLTLRVYSLAHERNQCDGRLSSESK